MTDRTSMPEAGELIGGRYRVERALKRGGMGAVYIARHVSTDRLFAVKLMSYELTGDAEAEARFEREARAESAIDHPGIVKVYDIGKHGPYPYMVMELLHGESLGEFLARGPMPPDDALWIMLKVIDAMRAAHAHGVVHRDLKPDNIYLVAGDGPVRPKVLDFGISKLIDHEAHIKLTQTGVALGTPLYMSPEQVRGERDVDQRTDVYSLGVILYQMVTGKMPYTGSSYAELVFKIMGGDAPGIRTLNPELPAHLESVIRCAMAAKTESRYPDMESFAADLNDLGRGARPTIEARLSATLDTQEPTPFATTAQRQSMRRKPIPRAVWIAGAVAVLAVGVSVGALFSGPGGNDEAAAAADVQPTAAAVEGVEAPAGAGEVVAPARAAAAIQQGQLAPPIAPDAGAAEEAPSAAAPGKGPDPDRAAVARQPAAPAPRRRPTETPVLRVTPRAGNALEPTDSQEIKMVDDEIIDPYQVQ